MRPRCDVCGGPVDDGDLVLVVGPSSAFPPSGVDVVHVGCFEELRPRRLEDPMEAAPP